MFRSIIVASLAAPTLAVLCSASSDCASGEYCYDDWSDDYCTAQAAIGESCSSWTVQSDEDTSVMCLGTAICDASSGFCAAPKAAGESCSTPGSQDACFAEGYCNDSSVCASKISIGGTCTGTDSFYAGCVETAYCSGLVEADGPFTCDALGAEGDACTNSVQCGTSDEGNYLTCEADECYDAFGAFGDAVGGAIVAAAAIGTTIIIVAVVGGIVGCLCCVAVIYFVCIKK